MKIEHETRSITFKHSVSLDQFSQALKHFEKMFKLLSGRPAMYTDFTDWIMTTDFVEVGASAEEIIAMVDAKLARKKAKKT